MTFSMAAAAQQIRSFLPVAPLKDHHSWGHGRTVRGNRLPACFWPPALHAQGKRRQVIHQPVATKPSRPQALWRNISAKAEDSDNAAENSALEEGWVSDGYDTSEAGDRPKLVDDEASVQKACCRSPLGKLFSNGLASILLAAAFGGAMLALRPQAARAAQPKAETATAVTVTQDATSVNPETSKALVSVQKESSVKQEESKASSPVDKLLREGSSHVESGKLGKARQCLKRALALLEKEQTPNVVKKAIAYQLMAETHMQEGDSGKAGPLLDKVIEIRRGLQDEGDVYEKGHNLEQIASLYYAQGELDQAADTLKEAVALYESAGEEGRAPLAISLATLASVYTDQDRIQEVRPLFERILHMQGQAGVQGPDQAATVITLASIESLQGNFEESEALARKALTLVEQGGSGPEIAAVLSKLSDVLALQDKVSEAIPYAERAVELLETGGAENPPSELGVALADLGRLHAVQNDMDKAEHLLLRALPIVKDTDYEYRVFEDLAGVLASQGRHAEALTMYEAAVKLMGLQAGDPGYADTQYKLAALHLRNQEPKKAFPLLEKVVKQMDKDDPSRWQVLADLGQAYLETGRARVAESILEDAESLVRDINDENRVDFAKLLKTLAQAKEANREPAEAVRCYERAVQEAEKAGQEGQAILEECRRALEKTHR